MRGFGIIGNKKMKIFILHSRLSGYMSACWSELNSLDNVELTACVWPNQNDAPFEISEFSKSVIFLDRNKENYHSLIKKINRFKPDAIITSGWIDKEYVRVCKYFKGKGITIIAGSDSQWVGSIRQHFAAISSSFHVKKIFDIIWVAGERQRQFAHKLGFKGKACWDGYYCCDYKKFLDAGLSNNFYNRKGFICIGRLVPEKGFDLLAEAYQKYQKIVSHPWELTIVGSGKEFESLKLSGANMIGFVQPSDLPKLIAKSRCFILPSRHEPWGVVAQEAAASGLPLLLSDKCGSSPHLLRDGWNGKLFRDDDVNELLNSMLWIHNKSIKDLEIMANNSRILAAQYTPKRWANQVVEGISSINL